MAQNGFKLAVAAMVGLFAYPATAGAAQIDPLAASVLNSHNAARAAVGAAPLSWDPALAAAAAAWAQYLASTGRLDHSDRKARPGIGESLSRGSQGAYSVEHLAGLWSAEGRHFKPGIFPDNSRTGDWMDVAHYTQMIWPTTRRIGCAMASGRGDDYLVCRYMPKGNIDGRALPVHSPPPQLAAERGR